VKRFLTYWGRDLLMLLFVGVTLWLAISAKGDSHHQCERSRRFAPYVAAFYKAHDVMPPEVLADYRATIPKGC
jgi:hypothetical protein